MPDNYADMLAEVLHAQAGPVRTAKAADLYRFATEQAVAARHNRDTALLSLVRVDKMRPAEIERVTGISSSMTNYATNRSQDSVTGVDQPIETIRTAVAAIDSWETVAEQAHQIRDDGIRELLTSGGWSARDLPALVGLTASRISQIAGGLADTRVDRPSGQSRRPLRFASLPDIAAELSRRAALVLARDAEGSQVLQDAARSVLTVAEPAGETS